MWLTNDLTKENITKANKTKRKIQNKLSAGRKILPAEMLN